MSTKQISKDNREYWSTKLGRKFTDKRSLIESVHISEIRKQSDNNFVTFNKRLQIEKDLKVLAQCQKDYNDFFNSIDKKLQDKKLKLEGITKKLSTKLSDWAKNRNWEVGYGDDKIPAWDKEPKGIFTLSQDFAQFLSEKCYEETKKAFYKSKKGEEIKNINELEEQAEDLLHSDMIGSEVLRQISLIAKKTQIKINIPESLKQIA
tara:strand:- start:415 stop:1032 length:618 start_codon:yes stop_codon:yes gene_type:complete